MFKYMVLFIGILVYGRCNLNYLKDIPPNAYKYMYQVEDITNEYLKTIEPYNVDALIEHETCITLCRKRCWNPKSRLKTKREEGGGLGQITRVFNKSGRVRWDMLRTLRRKHPKELKDLTWNNIYDRPDLQIKALVLLLKGNAMYYRDISQKERIWFILSSYNGGFKFLNRERKKCKLRRNCNPDIWFGNVELQNARGHRKLYGNRTAWDINRHYVKDIKKRMNKYKLLSD